MDLIKVAEQAFAAENPVEHPSFNTGDTVSVHYKIVEGNKERIQVFRGVVIQVKGTAGRGDPILCHVNDRVVLVIPEGNVVLHSVADGSVLSDGDRPPSING